MLRELTDADPGQPLVVAVDRPSAEHAGTRATALPDLLIRYAAGTGNHAAGGFLILAGAPVAGVAAMQDFGPLAAKMLQVAR